MTEQNTGWRDISTAPKDWSNILLYPAPEGFNDDVVVGFFTPDTDEAWFTHQDSFSKSELVTPTHWQPLPPPPGKEVESELTIRSISGGECIAGYAVVRGDELVDTFDSRKDAELVVRVGGDEDVVRLVERRDALQARCDELEAAARDALKLLLIVDQGGGWNCDDDERAVVAVAKALRSVVGGGDIHADLRKPEQVVLSRQVSVPPGTFGLTNNTSEESCDE